MSNFPSLSFTGNADNADVVLTFSNIPGRYLEVLSILCGYTSDPLSATLLEIRSGATILAQTPITKAGLAPVQAYGFMSKPTEDLVITLKASGGAGIIGYVSAAARVV